jgi:hypothetical protein
MKVTEYVVPSGLDGRRRVRHVKTGGKITEFVVQYEIFVDGQWYPVVRYDTAHGYAHRDLLHADGRKEKTTLMFKDLNLCLTYAEHDLRLNWRNYSDQYLKEVRKR